VTFTVGVIVGAILKVLKGVVVLALPGSSSGLRW